MEKQEPNYTLRPRRSAVKGKYREMLGISQSQENSSESALETLKTECTIDSASKGCKIFLLPLVVSGESDVLADNTIEIEISEDVNVSELSDPIGLNEEDIQTAGQGKIQESPLRHIEEILKKNDQLIESIPEGPSFKKKGRNVKEGKGDVESCLFAK